MYVYIFWASIYFDLLIYIFNICDDILYSQLAY